MADDERRKDKRYKYLGDVKVGRPESTDAVPGTILDMSMGGCLMRVKVPVRLRKDTVVEVAFKTSYLAFRTLGNVRRCDMDEDGTTIGIAYLSLTNRGRQDLRELIDDMESQENPKLAAARR